MFYMMNGNSDKNFTISSIPVQYTTLCARYLLNRNQVRVWWGLKSCYWSVSTEDQYIFYSHAFLVFLSWSESSKPVNSWTRYRVPILVKKNGKERHKERKKNKQTRKQKGSKQEKEERINTRRKKASKRGTKKTRKQKGKKEKNKKER